MQTALLVSVSWRLCNSILLARRGKQKRSMQSTLACLFAWLWPAPVILRAKGLHRFIAERVAQVQLIRIGRVVQRFRRTNGF